jgi:demethylmenaquinone methyltransferase/2-methoxy-6-polyprenyl-1,4-benzoquinol methylase
LSTPAGKGPYVRRLFATIADRYDLITVLLSYGQDARWKRRLVAMAGPLTGRRVLDLACGTGDIALLAAAAGAKVTGLDVTPRMVALASAKASAAGLRVRFVVGDMTALPFPDGAADVVTTGYGLRNVPDLDAALREIHRVLAPGGRLLSLDFNRPASAPIRAAYHAYLTAAGSALGWLLHRDADTYRYIPESIRLHPGAPEVAERLRRLGFRRPEWRRVLGGLLAIHAADRA